jgi:hypothetical protein
MKLKGFLAGLAGGAVAAAAVVLLLVFVFDLGEVNKTVVQATPQTPTSYSSPSTTGTSLSPQQIYSTLSGGVVMVLSEFGSSGSRRAPRHSAPASWSTNRATSSPMRTWSTRAASAPAA